MKVPVGWLRDYVALPDDANAIVERLASLGFPVEEVIERPKLTNVVVGRIVKTAPHPNADRLTLCTVDVGLAEAVITLKALQSETSDFPVNLPVPDLGQPVLNLAIRRPGNHEPEGPSFAEFLQGFKTYFLQEFERGRDVDQIFAGLEKVEAK